MLSTVKNYYKKNPLQSIILVGLLLRLIAALTAHGYYAYDDHYKVVTISWDWVQGNDRDNWFVDDYAENNQLRNIYYPAIIAGILKGSYAVGITDNFDAMVVVQIIHGLFSLLIIFYSYKISQKLSGNKSAAVVGWLNAGLWLFPFLSVRTLIEWTCIPPMLAALWIYYKNNEKPSLGQFLWIGVLLGIAFTLRFQTAFITLGIGIIVLFRNNFKSFTSLSIGFIVLNIFTQGITDYFVCDMPFGKLIEYVSYNLEHSGSYLSRPVFDYLILCPVLLLPPLGFYLFFGSFKNTKQYLPIFLGTIIFFLVHSVFENKQERFIFPILPFLILLGTPWMTTFLTVNNRVRRWSLIFTFFANSYLLVMMTTNYTKKSKIEAMRFLDRQTPRPQTLLIENLDKKTYNAIPTFYFNDYLAIETIHSKSKLDSLSKAPLNDGTYILSEVMPGEEMSTERLEKITKAFPKLVFLNRVEGSSIDNFRFKLNKAVKNYEYNIYYIPKVKSQ